MQSPRRARAVWFVGPRSVEVDETDLPPPRDGEMLVRSAFSGISPGTEMLVYRGEVDETVALDETLPSLAGRFSYPFRYGYSCVGRVEESGGGLEGGGLEVGAPVFAFHPHQDRFVVAAAEAVPVNGIDLRRATLFPLVETALQVSLDAGPVADTLVVVAGLGVVGVLSAVLLGRAGAQVVGSDPRPWRRDVAGAMGVTAVTPDDLESVIAHETGGRGTPLFVEASGDPAALAPGLRSLAHEGTALVVSWYGTKPVSLPLGAEFHRRRLTIRSSQVSTIPTWLAAQWSHERRRRVAVDLLRELPLDALATHEFPFAAAVDAYREVDRAPEGLMHAALRYE